MTLTKQATVWSPEAEQDLLKIWTYLANEANSVIADRQLRGIDGLCRSLSESPFRGRARDELRPNLRSIAHAPHVIFYRVTSASIEIVRVIHGSRDLGEIFSIGQS